MSYAYSSLISKDKNVVVLMDRTYWGGYRKKLLWRKFINRFRLFRGHWVIRGTLLQNLWCCLQRPKRFYQISQSRQGVILSVSLGKTICSYLTQKPKTEAGKELRKIALLLCHTDKESFDGMLDEWNSIGSKSATTTVKPKEIDIPIAKCALHISH